MNIVEKRIKINLKNPAAPDVEQIENAITRSGLEPIRWAIVEMTKTEAVILANGILKNDFKY